MTILVTGGTGRTGRIVAEKLHEAKVPFLVLTRSGTSTEPYPSCRFDFQDPTTYGTPFEKASEPVKTIYLCIPMMESDTIGQSTISFVDFARKKGVRRFVLLSSTAYPPPTRIAGAVHQHLLDVGDVEYVILQPTWYNENFSKSMAPQIKAQSSVSSAAGDGKARWLSTDDVGACAFRPLTDTSIKNCAIDLLGPELLDFNDMLQIIGEVIGKRITHNRITLEQLRGVLESIGITGERAQIMVDLYDELARDVENLPDNGEVLRLTGKPPMTFRDWAEKNKAAWT